MSDSVPPRRLGFVLVDGFALMSYASVVEPFRAANMLAGKELYNWFHAALAGGTARASNGAAIAADQRVGDQVYCDTLFVFAGGDPTGFSDTRVLAWLRAIAARGTTIAGISGGPYILARAGLLDGYQATIHWEHRSAFVADFPAASLQSGLFVFDRRRLTCAGGMAGMDLAIELIEREQGHDLAARVSDWFIRSQPRSADEPQRLSLRDRYNIGNDRVLKVLARMEAALEEPFARADAAAIAGVSLRQLERLFARHAGATIDQTYMRIRLAKSEQLLRSTGMSITEIAMACGFRSPSHFARRFALEYGIRPSDRQMR